MGGVGDPCTGNVNGFRAGGACSLWSRAEGRASLNFCSLQPLLSVLTHCHSLGVFCSLLSRLQEDTVQRLRMDFWALPRRRSSATARPRCTRCCRRRGAGAGWAWINQLCSRWGSKTSEKRQMLTSWMWLKKTGKEKELCSVKSSEGEKEVL